MPFLQGIARVAIVLTVGVLAGCAGNILETRVNSFQDWPTDSQGKTFAFIQDYKADLEQKTYADLIANALVKNKLMLADRPQEAHYMVSFKTKSEQRERLEDVYEDDSFLYPTLLLGQTGGGDYFWFSGMRLGHFPRMETYLIKYNHHELALMIQNKRGASMYQAMVYADTEKEILSEVMPFLVNSAFDGFPNRDAKLRTIRFDLDKSIEHNTPIKVQSDNKH